MRFSPLCSILLELVEEAVEGERGALLQRLGIDDELAPLFFLGVLGDEELFLLHFRSRVLRLGEAQDMRLDLGEAVEEGLGHFIESLDAHHRPGEAEDGLAVGFLAVGGDQDVDAGGRIRLERLSVDREEDDVEQRRVDN